MTYVRDLASGLRIRSTGPEHALQLEQLQIEVFPTLADQERFKREHYLRHLELFPEGQFVALDPGDDRVVGMTSTLRMDFDFEHPQHTFGDVIEGGFLTSHNPNGVWLYGADMGIHPDYRRRGIARALYAARQATSQGLGLRGQITVGMLRGYGEFKTRMTAEEYYAKLLDGELEDPTVSSQLRVGFEPRGLVPNYLNDPVCDGYGVLLVMDSDCKV